MTTPKQAELWAWVEAIAFEIHQRTREQWTLVPIEDADHWCELTTASGKRLLFCNRQGKVQIRGSYPSTANSNGIDDLASTALKVSQPNVGVTFLRDPDQIGRMLAMKFLPQYDALFDWCDRFVKEWNRGREMMHQHGRNIAAALGVKYDEDLAIHHWQDEDSVSFDLHVQNIEQLDVAFRNLSEQQVMKVLAVLDLLPALPQPDTQNTLISPTTTPITGRYVWKM